MDIDLDLKTDFDPLDLFDVVRASMVKNDKLAKHNVGVYFQSIPVDSMTGLAAIPYQQAEEAGYLKLISYISPFLMCLKQKKKSVNY